MKIRMIIEMELTDDAERPLEKHKLQDVLDDTNIAITNRLFGEGFLPGNVLVDRYTVSGEIVD